MSTLAVVNIVCLAVLGFLLLVGFTVTPRLRKNAQRKQQKHQTTVLEGLKKGDKVLTVAGIRGTFVKRKGSNLYLEIAVGVIVRFDKHSIIGVYEQDSKV